MTSPLSADELKALAALPLTPAVKLGLMNGQFTFSELALAGTSAQPAPDTTHSTDSRNTELNFPILLATLRAVNDENPFVGSSSSKSKAWDAVYKVYKDRGGTKEIGWLRAKVSECIAVHEEVKTPQASQDTPSSDTEGVSMQVLKSKKPTQLIRNLVLKNHIMLASVLEAISHKKTKSFMDTAAESSKRRQIETKKREMGKAIIKASLQACRKALAEHNDTIELSDKDTDERETVEKVKNDAKEPQNNTNGTLKRTNSEASNENLSPKRTKHSEGDKKETLKRLKHTDSDEKDFLRRQARIKERKGKGRAKDKEMKDKSKWGHLSSGSGERSVELLQGLSEQLRESNDVHKSMLVLEREKFEAQKQSMDRLISAISQK
ncbi:hypothetical protein C8R42DRAFT_637041 [Lentinula raphanica]|nr:hypothetical protein C8R42DRAFT_637041 [Lentinula raphanica]